MKRRKGRPLSPDLPHARVASALILIVEDNGDLLQLYSTYFTAQGFRVETASDGRMALVQAVELTPDLIVTDLALPHLGGLALMRQLKNDPRTAHIPIIACTGHVFGMTAELALVAGCDLYMIKPCFPEDLLREAILLLARSPARRRSA
jgi:two-component system, cell cycle response regulator DivK